MDSVPRRPRANKNRFKTADTNPQPFLLSTQPPVIDESPKLVITPIMSSIDATRSEYRNSKTADETKISLESHHTLPATSAKDLTTTSSAEIHQDRVISRKEEEAKFETASPGTFSRIAAMLFGRSSSGQEIEAARNDQPIDSADMAKRLQDLLEKRDRNGFIQEISRFQSDAFSLDAQINPLIDSLPIPQVEEIWRDSSTLKVEGINDQIENLRADIKELEAGEFDAVQRESWDEAENLHEKLQTRKNDLKELIALHHATQIIVINAYLTPQDLNPDPDRVTLESNLEACSWLLRCFEETLKLAHFSDSLSPISATTLDNQLEILEAELKELSSELDTVSETADSTVDSLNASLEELNTIQESIDEKQLEIDHLTEQLTEKNNALNNLWKEFGIKTEDYDRRNAEYLQSKTERLREIEEKRLRQKTIEQRRSELLYFKNISNYSKTDFMEILASTADELTSLGSLIKESSNQIPESAAQEIVAKAEDFCKTSSNIDLDFLTDRVTVIKDLKSQCEQLIEEADQTNIPSPAARKIADLMINISSETFELERELQELIERNHTDHVDATSECERIKKRLKTADLLITDLTNSKTEAIQAHNYVTAKTISEDINQTSAEIERHQHDLEVCQSKISDLEKTHTILNGIVIPTGALDDLIKDIYQTSLLVDENYRHIVFKKMDSVIMVLASRQKNCSIKVLESVVEYLKKTAAFLRGKSEVAVD